MTRRPWIRLVGGLLLAAVLLWAFLGRTDGDAALAALGRARPDLLALSLAATLISSLFRSARWRVLLSPLDPDVPLGLAWRCYNLGLGISTAVPGRAGELARCWLMARSRGLSLAATLGTLACEFTLDLVLVLALFGALLVVPGVTGDATSAPLAAGGMPGDDAAALALLRTGAGAFLVPALVGALVLALLATRPDATLATLGRLARPLPVPVTARFLALASAFAQGVAGLRGRGRQGALLLHSFLAWGAVGLATWAGLTAFGLSATGLQAAWLAAASALGMAVPTPGGLGSYHAVGILVVGTLWGLGGPGDPTVAAWAVTSHLLMTLPAVALGAIYSVREGVSPAVLREPTRALQSERAPE